MDGAVRFLVASRAMVDALARRPTGTPPPRGVKCVVAALALFGALTAPGCSDSADSENQGAASGGTPATQGGASGATFASGGKPGTPSHQTGGTAASAGSGGDAPAQGGTPASGASASASGDGGAADPSGGADASGGRDGSDAGAAGELGGAGGLGAGGEAGAGGAEGLTIDEFCELLQPRARSWLRTCRFNFGDASGWWGTENIDRFCTTGRAAVAAGRLSYDPVRAEACAAKSVGDCTTIAAFAFAINNGFPNTQECSGVVVGNVPAGGECHADSTRYSGECAQGVCGGDTCPGHCQGYVPLGDDCDSETPCDPAEGLCLAGSCEAYPGPEEPCAEGSFCAPGLLCVGDVEPSPTCLEPRAVGETCQAEAQCTGGVCRSGKCTDQVALNDACNSDSNCPAGAYCQETCKPRLALLAACDTTVPCLEGAECRAGTCQVLGGAGDTCPCASDAWCDDTNHCRNPGELEADCSRSDELNLFNRCAVPLVCRPHEADEPAALTCLPPGAEGEPCRPQFAHTCQAPLFCHPSTARCQVPSAEDEACNPVFPLDSCQAGLSCRCTSNGCTPGALGPGVCRPRVENGGDCASNSECRSGVCSAQKCAASPGCP